MGTAIIPVGRAREVCHAADAVLRANGHRIRDDRLDGQHWACFCYRHGAEIVSRLKAAEHRRSV